LALLEVPLFAHGHTAGADEFTLLNFLIKEGLDSFNLVVLSISQVVGDFVEVEGSLTLISVGHVLGAVLSLTGGIGNVLELKGSDGVGGNVEGQGGLVTLVNKVPDVNAVCLSDEDNTRAGGRECTTGVVGLKGVC
jgi:hypothetical protein